MVKVIITTYNTLSKIGSYYWFEISMENLKNAHIQHYKIYFFKSFNHFQFPKKVEMLCYSGILRINLEQN